MKKKVQNLVLVACLLAAATFTANTAPVKGKISILK